MTNPVSHKLLTNVFICLGLGILAFYLLTEHYAHVMGALPYVLLLSCPLMHLFMHRSHEHSHGDHAPQKGES